jgi:hypothetical protein
MKLKQRLAFGLCLFYTLSVIGLALSMHFCGGKLASVAIYTNKTACKYCKSEPIAKKDDGCCKNTKVEVKVKDSHETTAAFKLPKLFSTSVFLPSIAVALFQKTTLLAVRKIDNKAPPSLSRVAIHVFNCVFRN